MIGSVCYVALASKSRESPSERKQQHTNIYWFTDCMASWVSWQNLMQIQTTNRFRLFTLFCCCRVNVGVGVVVSIHFYLHWFDLFWRKYPVPHWIQVHGKINDSHTNRTEIESARVCIAHARTTFFLVFVLAVRVGGGGGDALFHLWNYTDPTNRHTFVPRVFYRLPSRTLNFEHSLECKTTTTTTQHNTK